MVGMMPIEVTEGKNGELMINNGVTRATRIHQLAPGRLVPVEVTDVRPKANFSKPYDEAGRERPLGAEPLVVARINTGRNEQGKHVLMLLPHHGQGVTLALDDTLLHGLCKLLQDVTAKAEWDMALNLPTGAPTAGTDAKPRVLN